ncbi:MAG: hypothetical protein ACR2PS_16360 [Pseudomonadales bacterium]
METAVEHGISSGVIASTALSAAFASLVKTHGPEAAAGMADRLAAVVRAGKFDHSDAPAD